MWIFQRPFLFTDQENLLNCWTKVIPALIPVNLTIYFFQKENVHLSLPFIFYFRDNFLCVTKHFLQFQIDTFFFAMAFDAKHCSHLLKIKIDYIFSLSFIHSMNTYPSKRIHNAVNYSFPLCKWHYFPQHSWNVQSPLLFLIFTNLTTFIIWKKRKRNSYVPNVARQILYNK